MADDSQDKSQKTEEPTSKKLEDAREKGKLPMSREVVSFAIFLSTTLMIVFLSPSFCIKCSKLLQLYIAQPENIVLDEISIIPIAQGLILIFLGLALVPLLINSCIIILSYFLQHNGFVFAPDALKIDFSKISILKGLKRLFSLKSIVEVIKGIIKISLVGVAGYFAIKGQIASISSSFLLETGSMMKLVLKAATNMMLTICFIMFLIAIVDFLYQKFEYIKDMMMSKKDIKDEHKSTEGDPEIKAKQQAKRRNLLRNFNAADIAKADVIITNPTHYAIALEYDPKIMHAPKILGKGKDEIALKIREIAGNNLIPIVRNPPLARALYDVSDVGEFIPLEHYKAVAEVISYVLRLKKNKKLMDGLK